jgi:hypothetical protein
MGRGIIEAGLFRSERVKLETRTSDPASPADGERWLRTDLDSGTDKLAELRWFDGSVTNGIKVVAPGSTDSDIAEVLRVETPNGTGVVPAVSPPGDAIYSSQRLRHAGADYGLGVIDIPDGKEVYFADRTNANIVRWTLNTAYDLSSVASTQKLDISAAGTGDIRAVEMRPDGTDLWMADNGSSDGGDITPFDLSTGYDLSTASQEQTITANVARDFRFSPGGTEAVYCDEKNDNLEAFTLSTAWDLSTVTKQGKTSKTANVGAVFNADGTVCVATNGNNLTSYNLSTAYRIDTGTEDFSESLDGTDERGLSFNTAGDTLFTVDRGETGPDGSSSKVREYTLSTDFDVSTKGATPDNTFNAPSADTMDIRFVQPI